MQCHHRPVTKARLDGLHLRGTIVAGGSRTNALFPLEFGGGNSHIPQYDGIANYASAGGDFENTIENNIHAFIITTRPRGNPDAGPDEYMYHTHVVKIHEVFWWVLNFNNGLGSVNVIGYDIQDPLTTMDAPWGKVVVMYDPLHAYGLTDTGGCTNKAATEVWVENAPAARYHDERPAFPNQLQAR